MGPHTHLSNKKKKKLNSVYWYWVLARDMVMTMYHHMKSIPNIHTRFNILVLGLGLGHMVMTMYHHMKSLPIIHTRFNILVLGLGQGLMLFQ